MKNQPFFRIVIREIENYCSRLNIHRADKMQNLVSPSSVKLKNYANL